MTRPTRSTLVALCGTAALALAACGGGGDSDEDKIRDVISDVDENPVSLCTEHGTDELVQQVGGEAACKAAAEQSAKDEELGDSEVESVEIDGDKATAKVKDDTGTSTVSFVKEDGEWLVSDAS